MLQGNKRLVRVAMVFAALSLVCVAPLLAATDEVELNGMIYASEWDDNGNVTAVVIETEGGEEIAVSKSGKGLELLKLEDRLVTVSGMITSDHDGNKTITITRYLIQE
jgi:hypothetical protein